jgi:modification methylase
VNRSEHAVSTLWAVGQRLPRVQRDDWYGNSAGAHPAKMWPQTARHAVTAFSSAGDVVVDPMCGIGTTLIEAARLGRHAWGVDCEPDWVAATAASLHAARAFCPDVEVHVRRGDARRLSRYVPKDLRDQVDLVLTSPPYGRAAHGRAYTRRETGGKVAKTGHQYSTGRPQPAQLARTRLPQLLEGLRDIFTGCHDLLKPGGRLVIACRPFTDRGTLIDYPTELTDLCTAIGFRIEQRCVALLAEWDPDRGLRPIHSFFGLHNTRTAIEQGRAALLRSHEDLLVLIKDGA